MTQTQQTGADAKKEAPLAQPPKKEEPKIDLPVVDRDTVFLSPDGAEGEAALNWLLKYFPDIFEEGLGDEILRMELDVAQLSKHSKVYVLARKRKHPRIPLTDAQPVEQSPDGQRITLEMPLEKMVDEVRAFGPINCVDFFSSSGQKWQAPRLNTAAFLSKLAELSAPWVPDSTEKCDLKNGQLPTRFKLMYC